MKLANIERGQASNWYPWYKIDEQYRDWSVVNAIEALYNDEMKKHLKSKLDYLIGLIDENLGKELS